jgi:signal transduction histidine kinase
LLPPGGKPLGILAKASKLDKERITLGVQMGTRRIKFDLLIHDLKTPLAVIEAGLTSLIERSEKYGPLTEKQKKVLRRALRNTKVTQTLVNDAMEIGRSSEGIIHTHRFTLSNLIEQALVELFDLTDNRAAERLKECVTLTVLKETLSERNIMLNVDENLWCREVFLDEGKIRQILRNLLNNALKYRKKLIEIKIETNGKSLFLSVRDDGDGIPSEYHQKIFECYFQMDTEQKHCVRGHGLGLAGVMVLVEDMGGRLSLESDLGKGAMFLVEVPLQRPT